MLQASVGTVTVYDGNITNLMTSDQAAADDEMALRAGEEIPCGNP